MPKLALLVLCVFVLNACGITPSHEIKPRPDHIKVGVQAGDKLEIVTNGGEQIELVVVEVTSSSIKSADRDVAFRDIEKLTKRSWIEPAHPCGAGEPVGCSVPAVFLLLSNDYENQVDKFRKPCVAHDFCYRHGSATYGLERLQCDEKFYDDMRQACNAGGLLDVLDPKERTICEFAANRTYAAVREHGEEAFRSSTSTYCEYL
jgi:hypothetical protein